MLIAESTDEPSLSRDDVFTIQTTLNELGFDAGKPDGFSGPKTRNATRDYQRANNLAVDGYVGYQLLQRLKKNKMNIKTYLGLMWVQNAQGCDC
ncbi:hypothetical protein BSPWISOXPB_2208 [uncultured Gammaproteobacteria bacterium]|nr:hypothetical protein BSPWISOXPB_2208 [uncultured Gammaproteobacteria bacterium]